MAPHAKSEPPITIILPVPPRCLSPNGRPHWATRAKARAAQRDYAMLRTREAMPHFGGFKWPCAAIKVKWFGKTKQCLRLDPDNIFGYLKGAVDGLADAGLILNDRNLTWLPPERAVDRDNPRLEITISKVD